MMTLSSYPTAARRMRAVCILASLLMAGSYSYATGEMPPAVQPPIAATPVITPSPKPITTPAPKVAPAANMPTVTPSWTALTPDQKRNLAPLAAVWDAMDSVRKEKWLAIERKLSKMKPEDQLRTQERMRDWAKLSPEQRRVARENYTKSKKLDRDQKSAQWQEYQQLSEEQKQKLAATASADAKKHVANLPPEKSKNKTVAPIKATPKGVLEKSVTPEVAHKAAIQPTPTPANK
jgi:hypothetical protein